MCCPVFFQLFCKNKCVFTLYAFERHVFPLTDRFVSKQIPTLDGIETETESTKKTRFESQKVKVDIQLIPCSERIKIVDIISHFLQIFGTHPKHQLPYFEMFLIQKVRNCPLCFGICMKRYKIVHNQGSIIGITPHCPK